MRYPILKFQFFKCLVSVNLGKDVVYNEKVNKQD